MTKPSSTTSFEFEIARFGLIVAAIPTLICLILLLMSPISNYLKAITLIFLFTLVVFGGYVIWLRIHNQLRATTNIIEAVVSGDSTMKPSSQFSKGALAELNFVINQASKKLADQRLVSKEHHLAMAKILEHINVAVISIDDHGFITLLNPKAKDMFLLDDGMLGLSVKDLGIDVSVVGSRLQKVVELTSRNLPKKVFLQTDFYHLDGQQFTLLFFNDVQKLLQEEERKAWQKLLRVLQHEINNSLAPIASIGESLMDIVTDHIDESEAKTDLQGGLKIIKNRALSLDTFIKEYKSLSLLPAPNKESFSLMTFLQQQADLFSHIKVELAEQNDISIFADSGQLAQVVVNLLKNAEQSKTDDDCVVKIHWQVNAKILQIKLVDNGTGIINLDNLFVPFYTTKKEGSGIGLVLSRQILFNHGGDLTLTNNTSSSGATAAIQLPII